MRGQDENEVRQGYLQKSMVIDVDTNHHFIDLFFLILYNSSLQKHFIAGELDLECIKN